MNKLWLLVVPFSFLFTACDFTEKLVGKPQTQLSDEQTVVNVPLRLAITGPELDGDGKVGSSPFVLEGNCKFNEGFVFVDGDVEDAELKTPCLADNTFAIEVTPTKPYKQNSVTVRQSDGDNIVKDNLDFLLFVRAPFCGDGTVNQDFEVCDSGLGCSETCQFGDDFPADLVLARVIIEDVQNEGNGQLTNDIHLGEGETSIPSGVWFVLSDDGFDFVDEDAATFAADGPGLAVSRANGSFKVLLQGDLSSGLEHVTGRVQILGAGIDDLDDGVGDESLESFFDGIAEVDPDEDELDVNSGEIEFHMTVDKNDNDAFIVDWF